VLEADALAGVDVIEHHCKAEAPAPGLLWGDVLAQVVIQLPLTLERGVEAMVLNDARSGTSCIHHGISPLRVLRELEMDARGEERN
jgi:hypothetical protein